MTELGPIPLDDDALTAIEHALNAVYTLNAEGQPQTTDADYNLPQLLDFWSGFDRDDGVHDGYIDGVPVYVFEKPTYSERDLLRALVAEVRRLRAPSLPEYLQGTQVDGLRELVTYCRDREVYKGRDNEIGADTAYGDVADQLEKMLAAHPAPHPRLSKLDCGICTRDDSNEERIVVTYLAECGNHGMY